MQWIHTKGEWEKFENGGILAKSQKGEKMAKDFNKEAVKDRCWNGRNEEAGW